MGKYYLGHHQHFNADETGIYIYIILVRIKDPVSENKALKELDQSLVMKKMTTVKWYQTQDLF